MPPFAQDPCWRPAVFRRAPSAPARSVRVSHDSDPASVHDPRSQAEAEAEAEYEYEYVS